MAFQRLLETVQHPQGGTAIVEYLGLARLYRQRPVLAGKRLDEFSGLQQQIAQIAVP